MFTRLWLADSKINKCRRQQSNFIFRILLIVICRYSIFYIVIICVICLDRSWKDGVEVYLVNKDGFVVTCKNGTEADIFRSPVQKVTALFSWLFDRCCLFRFQLGVVIISLNFDSKKVEKITLLVSLKYFHMQEIPSTSIFIATKSLLLKVESFSKN